jgi:phage nucleotide-binding protein
MSPIEKLVGFIEQYQNGMTGFKRFCDIIDEKPEAEMDGAATLENVKGDVEFENVTFGYNDSKQVLSDMSFRLQSGKTLALVGPSGGGKTVNTTLVKAEKRKKNILLCSDNSHIVLNNFKRDNLATEVVEHWMDKDNVGKEQNCFSKQFDKAVESKAYDNIIVDNISDIFDLAILEMDASGRYKDMRQAYQIVYQELKRLARKAAQVDCNVIFTAWTDLQEINLPDGTKTVRTQPKLPNKILDNFLGLTQIVAYINTADKDGQKAWYYVLEGRPTMYAKDQFLSRKSCMPEDLFSGK